MRMLISYFFLLLFQQATNQVYHAPAFSYNQHPPIPTVARFCSICYILSFLPYPPTSHLSHTTSSPSHFPTFSSSTYTDSQVKNLTKSSFFFIFSVPPSFVITHPQSLLFFLKNQSGKSLLTYLPTFVPFPLAYVTLLFQACARLWGLEK